LYFHNILFYFFSYNYFAFSLTDFVSCGFANFFFSKATSAKNAASDFFSLGTFHRSLIAF